MLELQFTSPVNRGRFLECSIVLVPHLCVQKGAFKILFQIKLIHYKPNSNCLKYDPRQAPLSLTQARLYPLQLACHQLYGPQPLGRCAAQYGIGLFVEAVATRAADHLAILDRGKLVIVALLHAGNDHSLCRQIHPCSEC
ncbi:hypothetical protein FGO68_gene7403 [Halteria grandinella]|uniref:Uncharacterized protein n=1 Tax=Halteria grandinella TaxID=5974 RepID=A0A8J8SU62_HALGN|nr:hypothetical protein FGO68_gene7403 [Halteria grandinella]